MSDFFQNGVITTFHKLGDTDLCRIEDQLKEFSHPGGLTIHQGQKNFYLPKKPKEIAFAKLKEGDKEFLWEAIAKIPKNGIYVEVGSYKGGGAALAALANPSIKIYCVDIWKKNGNKDVFTPFNTWRRHTQFFPNIKPIKVDLNGC